MSESGGISRMGTVAGSGEDAPQLGIGMLGYAFMCNAHTNAFLSIPPHDVSAGRHSAPDRARRPQ